MDAEIQEQLIDTTQDLARLLYKAGIALFLVLLFKDAMSDFAYNVLTYIKMRFDKKTYSVEGGKIEIGGEQYVIIDISLGYVHLKKIGPDGKRCRMTTKDYWSSKIFYIDNRELKEK